jgi:phenylglyoxylate dehydrogenase beta subunit
LHFTRPVDQPLPVTEYLQAMGRFRHLSPEQVTHIQSKVVENLAFVQQMTHRPALAT